MHKTYPTVLSKQVKDHHAVLSLRIDQDIIFFKGHFEGHPVLPGVTQLHWVITTGKDLFNLNGHFSGMEAIKFKDPILPGHLITMTLEWHEAINVLQFKCRSETGIHSSGRIKLDA